MIPSRADEYVDAAGGGIYDAVDNLLNVDGGNGNLNHSRFRPVIADFGMLIADSYFRPLRGYGMPARLRAETPFGVQARTTGSVSHPVRSGRWNLRYEGDGGWELLEPRYS